MSTKKQQFYGESKLYFFLREPKRTGPRLVYLSTYIGGKHYVLSAKVKVYACQWNYKKQLAVISNVQSKQDNRNNKIVNDQLSKVRRYFSEFIEYICNNDVDDIGETLKLFIYRDMAKKKKIDLKRIIAEALEYYHTYVKKTIKDSTKRQNESLLSEFGRFVDTLPEKDKTMQVFSQKGLNRYKQYLIDKMDRSKTDGKKRNFGVGQLNRCGSIIALLINRVLVEKEDGISTVVWNKVDDPRSENQKGHVPLLDHEVAAIENCSGLTDVEKEYRNIFLLQIECGTRVSDLAKLLTGEFVVGLVDGRECILISTKKENIPAVVDLTPRFRMLMERIKAHKLVDPQEFKNKTEGKGNNTYNEAIRRIAKKAGLNRVIVKIDSNQIEEKRPLYEVITNHDARSTFITNKIKEGMPPNKLCIMTGHASDEMINRVYAQLTIEDKIRSIMPYLSSSKNEEDADSPTDTLPEKPNESATDALETPIKSEEPIVPIARDEDSQKQFNRGDYVKGLSDVVEKALSEFRVSFNEREHEVVNETLVSIEKLTMRLYSKELNSKDNVIECWQTIDSFFKEGRLIQEDDQMFNIARIHLLHYLIDYSIEHQIGNEGIEELEKHLREICEENFFDNIVYYTYRYPDIMLPIDGIQWAAISAMHYVLHNRPNVDEYYIKVFSEAEDLSLKGLPDWNIVLGVLQRIPDTRLQSIIGKTKIPSGDRIKIYNSIVSGDVNQFAKVIQSCGDEVNILVYYAYYINWIDTNIQSVEQKENHSGDQSFSEIGDSIQEVFWSYPFSDMPSINIFLDYKEQRLNSLDNTLHILGLLKKHAYSSEIKVFNKVLNRINQFPKLKAAYNEYKAKQNAASDVEQPKEQVKAPKDKKEENPEEQKKQTKVPNFLPDRTNNIDIDELVRLLTQKDKLNNNHIFVTLVKCDSGEADVATCLKHFLDYTSSTLSFKLRWNDKNKVSLKFLIRLLFNTNGKATIRNVIEKDAKKAYDGISDKVSTGQGGFPIWPSVIEVFENCPKSIEQAGLGDEGSDAREYNLKQLRTIAKMYFACRKDSSKKT